MIMENSKEIWKDIPGYEGCYAVSNLGRVKSLTRTIIRSNGSPRAIKESILKPHLTTNKYHYISLGQSKNNSVHRMVASAFCFKPEGKDHVDHINSIRTDNRAENLQWVTPQENIAKQSHSKGNEHYNSIITAKDVVHIRAEYDKLVQTRKYGAIKKIADGCGLNYMIVSDVVNLRTWKHVR
jgi:hypothetical protein